MNKLTCWLMCAVCGTLSAQNTDWPEIKTEAKPAARWWWMGSAVDKANLTRNLEAYAAAGMGGLEITPIYGVQGNDANEIPYLSPLWMDMLRFTESEAARLGMQIDMNNGTGWPFGGPEVSVADAACRLLIREYQAEGGKKQKLTIAVDDPKQAPLAKLERLMAFGGKEGKQVLDLTSLVAPDGTLSWKAPKGGDWRLIAAFCGKTRQQVKRAAPGGEGYVMDHFSPTAVKNYLGRFDRAFDGKNFPNTFFNDSYEVYGADWTEGLFDLFLQHRGYKLEEHLPEFLTDGAERTDEARRIVSDYRETLAELLLENFTRQWTDWAHSHQARTRNQAHGSPGNLIDLYATVDIPECEGFGLSDFHIRGLRRDSLTRRNDSDLSMLKYASSGAHLAGKPLTSSETFTWLTEHFRTSLSQCKPDLDLFFLSGVNHVFFHGTTYSPTEAAWPGWKFYASIDMSPTNSIWRDAPAFFQYISRCQSFLQMGKPDNDFLVYLPVYDMWQEQGGRLLMFDIHGMAKRAPRFIAAVDRINAAGYDVDYISDNFIRTATLNQGLITTQGGSRYKGIIIPGAKLMPADVVEKLLTLARQGAKVIFLDQYPEDVPGYAHRAERGKQFTQALEALKGCSLFGCDYAATLAKTGVCPERMKPDWGVSYLRRTHAEGHHYFLSALSERDAEGWMPLAVKAQSAVIYNPMNGTQGKAQLRQRDGKSEVYLQLKSGESLILKTFSQADVEMAYYPMYQAADLGITLSDWGFRFLESTPAVGQTPERVTTGSWTDMPFANATTTMGTALYTTTFQLSDPKSAADWTLQLGDVRESARIRVNGQEVTTLWAVPFECRIGAYLKKGENQIEVEVTNLPANRIAQLDREGKQWRIFKEINLVDLNYKKTGYAHWAPMPSGLLGPVRVIPQKPTNL